MLKPTTLSKPDKPDEFCPLDSYTELIFSQSPVFFLSRVLNQIFLLYFKKNQ